MNGSHRHVIGIDVAKHELVAYEHPTGARVTCGNDAKGFAQLRKTLPSPEHTLVVVEASGGYERRLVAEVADAGYRVAVVNPRQVRDYARALGLLAKNDRLDAQVIARFGAHADPRPFQKSPQKQVELEELVARRRQLVEHRTADMNRREGLQSEAIRRSVQQMVDHLNKEIKRLEKDILALIASDDDWQGKAQLLQSVPGLGPVTAAALLADLPELGQVNRQEIVALAGLAPYDDDSGRRRGQRSIWGGRAAIRSTLYMAALTARRCNPVIRAFAQRLTDKGKRTKVVLTACMRKLLVILNTMMKNNAHWNPAIAQ